MRTYSHLAITAWVAQRLSTRPGRPFLLGAVLPDAPLALLTAGYLIDRRYVRPHLPDKTRCSPTYNHLYFHNPWWIAAHNSLHAPLLICLIGGLGALGRRTAWGQCLLWFAAGCGLHSAIDLLTHVDDGPLLWFPLDWQSRFTAPISYWDAAHGGGAFRLLEHLLDALLVVVLLRRRLLRPGGPKDATT